MRVDAVARMIHGQMFPGSQPTASRQAPQQEGFQSGTSQKESVNAHGQTVKTKTTKVSFMDMVAKAKAGIDTSIRGL